MDSNDEKEKERLKKYAAFLEPWSDIYGFKYSDIPYDIDGKIKNTFKKGEINYDEDIGNINDGKDYDKSEKNIYDLYIPYSSFIQKKSKGIFLFFHGLGDTKNTIEGLCARYTKNGYITATIETTSLGGSKETSIFKSLDETTYCIISIKNKLSKMNFNPETLEIALGGHSAGAYNALLYSYFMRKNCPIPIKFVINLCAQATMDPNYWFKFKNPEESLENLKKQAGFRPSGSSSDPMEKPGGAVRCQRQDAVLTETDDSIYSKISTGCTEKRESKENEYHQDQEARRAHRGI